MGVILFGAMRLIPVSFRCTLPQMSRLETALAERSRNRSALINEALESFLRFVERAESRRLSLFQLVEQIDSVGARVPFSAQV